MRALTVILISILAVAAAIACSKTPPDEYLTPEFEEVVIDDSADGVRFICKMSSMAQLTEYGLDYTDDWEASKPVWKTVPGTKSGEHHFEVLLNSLEKNTTYCYRLFIGNGRDLLQSQSNYFTTSE